MSPHFALFALATRLDFRLIELICVLDEPINGESFTA